MKLVIVTISVSGRSALIRPMAVTPSMFGIRRSISTTSGSSRRAIATPSLPSAASPTTVMSSWRSKKTRRPIRTTEWSSTMSTRIRVSSATVPPVGAGRESRVAGAAGAVESSKVEASSGSGHRSAGGRDHGIDQLVRPERLADVGVGAARLVGGVRPVEDQDPGGRGDLSDPGDERRAGVDARQAGIDDHDIGSGFLGEAEGGVGRAGAADDETALADPEEAGEALPHSVVGVDEEHAERRR